MGRWRPPPEKSAPYITAEGAQKLQQELKQLWKVERPETTAIVKAAAANGDRSENGDYIYGKQRLRELDRRIQYLSKRLDAVTIVDKTPKNQSKIFFGAWVTLWIEDLDEEDRSHTDNEKRYRIVGYDEIDAKKQWISVDSPLAKALLGKSVDDEVSYKAGDKNFLVTIIDISY